METPNDKSDDKDAMGPLLELEMIQSEYDYIRFTIVDFHGITRSKTVPRRQLEQFFETGCSFFSGAIGFSLVSPMVPRHVPSIRDTNSGNVFARPQWTTLHSLPLNGAGRWKVGEVICETYFPVDGSTQTSNPRTIARTQLDKLAKLGYGLKSSWELEVCFLDEKSLLPNFNRTVYVCSSAKFDEMEEVMCEAEQVFRQLGIRIETLQTEASPGQYEFVTCPVTGITQADNLVLMKDALRQLAKKHGKKAVFMSQPFLRDSISSALHFNHSLTAPNNEYVFSDVAEHLRLSEVCRWWVSGLLKHSAALTALCNPTVNCYRRLHNFSAPSIINWGIDARAACYRVKNYSASSTYIECRSPSGSANPYLVMAATVAAGIDGLVHKYDCPAPGTESVSAHTELPRTLAEALEALRSDPCICQALGDEFVDWFATIKQNEIRHFDGFKSECSDESILNSERECYMDLL